MVYGLDRRDPGVNVQGKTLKEAKDNLKEAILLILQTNREIMGNKIGLKREPLSVALPA